MSLLARVVEPNNLRLLFAGGAFGFDVLDALHEDLHFARVVARALLSPSARDERASTASPFPPFSPIAAPTLRGKRIGLVASGGSGALASLCGVRRAFEEAGLEVAAISACSGAVLFAAPWAFGSTAEEMASFWLGLRTRDYVDPDVLGLLRAGPRRMRRWGGLLRGEALARTFRGHFGDLALGDADVPLHVVAWNIDENRVAYLGTTTTPDLPLATAVRVAISIPIFVEPVRIGGHLYGDGGVVSIFPARPLLDVEPPLDIVLGINGYFPEGFQGEDIGAWYERTWAILRASMQVRTCVSLELAREQMRLLGPRLTMLHPVPYTEIRGAKFYETFLDRTRWPEFMRRGRDAARAALLRLERRAARLEDEARDALVAGEEEGAVVTERSRR